MLKHLSIENFAIADEVSIDFDQKFNVITGETGAGKTIIINAFSLILGDRANTDIIRKKTNKAKIKAVFKIDKEIKKLLNDSKIEFNYSNNEVELTRIIHRDKRNRIYLNSQKVTLNFVKKITEKLVDLNNQNEHQTLMNAENHIDFIDYYGGYKSLINKYENKYIKLKNIKNKYKKYINNKKKYKRKLDNLKYEFNEIEKVDPKIEEDEKLSEEIKMLENSKDIIMAGNFIYSLADEDEMFSELMDKIFENVDKIKGVSKELDEYADSIEQNIEGFVTNAEELKFYIDEMELDENRLKSANERLNQIERLKNKYGDNIEEILEYKNRIREEIDEIESMSFNADKMKKKIDKLEKEVKKISDNLYNKRIKTADEFSNSIEKQLKFLGMEKSSFKVEFKKIKDGIKIDECFYNKNGRNFVEFFIQTNPGEGFYPIIQIASGGELSRILFSIKSIISDKFDVNLLIFDEIDSGIGGETSKKMAKKLKDLSDKFQLIVITHQPQIAAKSNKHLYVMKKEVENRTVSRVITLSEKEHIEEIARMIAGENINEHIIETAKSMCL